MIPTLKETYIGNISTHIDSKIRENILVGLEILDNIINGINSDRNLVFAPAIDRYWNRFVLDNHFMSSLENLYVIGDAAGYARGILQAAWTGVISAMGILNVEPESNTNDIVVSSRAA